MLETQLKALWLFFPFSFFLFFSFFSCWLNYRPHVQVCSSQAWWRAERPGTPPAPRPPSTPHQSKKSSPPIAHGDAFHLASQVSTLLMESWEVWGVAGLPLQQDGWCCWVLLWMGLKKVLGHTRSRRMRQLLDAHSTAEVQGRMILMKQRLSLWSMSLYKQDC